jgi:hypothetical protein
MQNDSVVKNQVAADSVEVRQLMQEVVKATAVYSRDGKPDLEKAQRGRAIELGISAEGIAAQWKQAKQNWHRVWLRKLSFGKPAAEAEVKPRPKPETQEKPEDEEGLPKDQGSPSSFGKGGFAGKLEEALGGNAKRILSGIKAQTAEPEPELDAPPTAPVWLPAELSGIANRCLAGYRRLLDRGRFIQPKSAEALTSKVKEAVNPFLGFMNECWIKDHESGGPTVGDFFETFLQWCREHQRWDLTHSVTRNNLITFITRIEEWKHLHSVKPKGKSRRYPGLRCKNRMNEF